MFRFPFSLLLVAFLASLAGAEPFGSFGYRTLPAIPGWLFDGESFRPDAPGGERIGFAEGLPPLRLESLDERRAIYRSGQLVYTPHRVRFDLLDLGPLLQCPKGLAVTFRSTSAPYLSWSEGSVGAGVPTPEVRWLAISFRNDAPPVVIGISGKAASFRLDGAPGAWTLRTSGKTDLGWVRLGLPRGRVPLATNTAAELGNLAVSVAKDLARWTAPPAELSSYEVSGDANGVTATWRFSRAGVVVPSGLYLAHGGGYAVTFLSEIERSNLPLPVGSDEPYQRAIFTTEREMKVRLPCRLLPRGRVVGVGSIPFPEWSTPEPAQIAPFALSLLLGERSGTAVEAAKQEVARFVQEAATSVEPVTGQRLIGDAEGVGLDRAAAMSLLETCRRRGEGEEAEDPLFTALAWRRDWRTAAFVGVESGLARRTAALAALAGAFSSDPSRRLEGALFQVGLAADRTRRTLLALEKGEAVPSLAEPFHLLRGKVFGFPATAPDPFANWLYGSVRVVSAFPVYGEAGGLRIGQEGAVLRFRLYGVQGPLAGGGELGDGSFGFAVPPGSDSWRLPLPSVVIPPAVPIPIWDETPVR